MSPAPATAPLPSHREWRYVSSIRCGSLDLKNLTRRLRCLIRFMCTPRRGSDGGGGGGGGTTTTNHTKFIYVIYLLSTQDCLNSHLASSLWMVSVCFVRYSYSFISVCRKRPLSPLDKLQCNFRQAEPTTVYPPNCLSSEQTA